MKVSKDIYWSVDPATYSRMKKANPDDTLQGIATLNGDPSNKNLKDDFNKAGVIRFNHVAGGIITIKLTYSALEELINSKYINYFEDGTSMRVKPAVVRKPLTLQDVNNKLSRKHKHPKNR